MLSMVLQSSPVFVDELPERRAAFAEGKEEAGQSDSPRVGNGEGTQASKAPHQRSITALFKKTAAATAKPIGSKPAAEGSGASGKSAARPAAEAQQPAAELQGKPQALEHGVMDDRSGSVSDAQAKPGASPADPPGSRRSTSARASTPAQASTRVLSRGHALGVNHG